MLLTNSGDLYLVDFGICRIVEYVGQKGSNAGRELRSCHFAFNFLFKIFFLKFKLTKCEKFISEINWPHEVHSKEQNELLVQCRCNDEVQFTIA
jgi:hypothetical protein